MKWSTLPLFVLIFMAQLSFGQRVIDFDYSISQPYPRTIGELVAEGSNISFTILNDIPRDINIYLRAELLITDAFGAERGAIRTPGAEFIPSSTIIIEANESLGVGLDFSFGDFGFTMDNLIFEGAAADYFQAFNTTDQQDVNLSELLNPQLPEGTYTLCLTAFEVGSNEQLSPKICSESFDIISTNIFISNPLSGDVVDCEIFERISWEMGEALADPNCMDYLVEVIQLDESSLSKATEGFFLSERVVREEVFGDNFLDEAFNQTTLDFTLPEHQNKYYALRVKASLNDIRDSDCEVTLRNGGYSDISIFQIKCDEDLEEELPVYDCATCDQASPAADELVPHPFTSLPDNFRAGYFKVKVISKNSSGNGSFNGKGTVDVSLFGVEFPVGVEFKNIQLNEKKQLVAGEVVTLPLAQNEDFTSRVTVPEDLDYTLADVKKRDEESYNSFVETLSTVEEVMAQIEGAMNGEGLKMPLGFDQVINGKNFKVVLDEMNFTPGSANMRSTFNLPLPFERNGSTAYISFGLSKLCFTPDGSVQNGRVHMVYDLPVYSSEDGYDFEVKGCEDCTNAEDSKGSFLEFDCEGVTGGRFECAIKFPNNSGTDDEGALSLSPYKNAYEDPSKAPDKVEAVFGILINAQSEDTGWIFDASMTPFEIGVLDGWGFAVKNASVDLSELYNPSQLQFPDDHQEYGRKFDFNNGEYLELTSDQKEKLPLWTGLYLKEVDVHLPPQLRGDAMETFSIKDAVIDFSDEFNLSLMFQVSDPFDNKILKLGRWNSRLKSIDLALVNNEFKRGNLGGQLYAPFLHKDDHFEFNAVMHKNVAYDEMEYAFIVNPGSSAEEAQPFRIPIFLAQATLNSSSYISMSYSESKEYIFKTSIFGKLGINPESANWLPGVSAADLKSLPLDLLGVPFVLNYETDKGFEGTSFALTPNLKEFYDSQVAGIRADRKALDESLAEMDQGFNPPPTNDQDDDGDQELKKKTLAGFELSFRNFELAGNIDKPRLYLEPYMHIMGGGGTAENSGQTEEEEKHGFGLGALIFVESAFDKSTNKYGDLKFGLECLVVDVQTASVRMSGGVCYKRTNLEKSFRGSLSIELERNGKGIAMAGAFGTRYRSNGAKDLSYWYARAAYKDEMGITIGPLAINGLAGGVFWNYNISTNYFNSFGRESFEPMDPLDDSLHENMEPQRGNFALAFFALGSPIGLDTKTLNFDATLRLKLGRQTSIGIGGNIFVMSKDPWNKVSTLRNETMIYGRVDGSLTFGSDNGTEFLLSSELLVNIPPNKGILTGNVPSEILVNSDEFHAYFGVPGSYDYTTREGLKMGPGYIQSKLGNDQANVMSRKEFYLMMGDGIPSQLYLPKDITDLMSVNSKGNADADWVPDISGEERPPALGSGVAFGAMVKYGAEFWLIENSDWKTGFGGFVMAGFDLNLTKSFDRSCGSYSPPGHKGWYALGQIYAGGKGDIYVLGEHVVELRAVALLQGGLPNPVWVDGRVSLSYDLDFSGHLTSTSALLATAAIDELDDRIFGDKFDYTAKVFYDEKEKGLLDHIVDGLEGVAEFVSGQELEWELVNSAKISGKLDVDFSYGSKCIPSIDYDNSEEAPIEVIKEMLPADGQEEVNFLSVEPSLKLHYGHNTIVSGIQIVEGGKLITISLKPKVKRFELKERRNGSWVSINKLEGNDFRTGNTFRRMISMEMKPSTRYKVIAIVDLYRGSDVFDTVKEQHRFRTGKIPDKLTEDFVDHSVPGAYELFFNHEDFDQGYIQFNAAAFNVVFGREGLTLGPSPIGGSNNSGGWGGLFDMISEAQESVQQLVGDATGSGSLSDLLQGQPTGPSIAPVPTGPRTVPPNTGPSQTPAPGTYTYKNQVRITNLNNPTDVRTVRASIDQTRKRIKYSLADLESSSAYKLTLEMRDGEGSYRRVYETKFMTSRYGKIEEKLASGRVVESTFLDGAIEFEEPFDNYSVNRFYMEPAIHEDDYEELNRWMFSRLPEISEALDKSSTIFAIALLEKGGSGGNGEASFPFSSKTFIDIAIQASWRNNKIEKSGGFNFGFSSMVLGNINRLKWNQLPLANGQLGVPHRGASFYASKSTFESIENGDSDVLQGRNRLFISNDYHGIMMHEVQSKVDYISNFMLAISSDDKHWKFKEQGYDITVYNPYKKFFESGGLGLKNAMISLAISSAVIKFGKKPAYRLFTINNPGTIYNF